MKIPELPAGAYWYVATPYSGWDSQHDAFVEACHITADLLRERIACFSPIAHSHYVGLMGALPETHEFWVEFADAPLLRSAHGVLVATIEGWEKSKGVAWEIEEARALGKPVYYLDVEDLTVSEAP